VSDEALVRFLPGQSQCDAPVALAVFWPEPQYRAVIAAGLSWRRCWAARGNECRARTQRYCLLVDVHGLRIVQVAGDAAGLGDHLAAEGVAQPSERNARCWCGSGVKYKRCCWPRA
jgi:hypothetical protein